jgi:hypothetical protein
MPRPWCAGIDRRIPRRQRLLPGAFPIGGLDRGRQPPGRATPSPAIRLGLELAYALVKLSRHGNILQRPADSGTSAPPLFSQRA